LVSALLLIRPMWFRTRHPRTPLRGNLSAFLDEGSEIEGRYVCAGTVMFNGRLRGELESADTLIVGERGRINGTLRANNVIVHGEIIGNVTATDRVELKGTARVTGDIEAAVIIMEEGVFLDGRCRMTRPRPAEELTTLSVVALGR
jgi:cytoskeletal protein CcmA (bactofilin family)